MKQKKRVYCKNCKFIDVQNEGQQQMFGCLSEKTMGNWLSPDLPNIPPDKKNVDNDCADFEQGDGSKLGIQKPGIDDNVNFNLQR